MALAPALLIAPLTLTTNPRLHPIILTVHNHKLLQIIRSGHPQILLPALPRPPIHPRTPHPTITTIPPSKPAILWTKANHE